MPTFTRINHLALTVTDLDRSAAWYQDVLGLVEMMRGRNEDVGVSFMINVAVDADIAIGLRQFDEAVDGARFSHLNPGMDHLALQVSDRAELEAWQERLADKGVTFTPIADHPIAEVLTFRDPDDIQLELWLSKV